MRVDLVALVAGSGSGSISDFDHGCFHQVLTDIALVNPAEMWRREHVRGAQVGDEAEAAGGRSSYRSAAPVANIVPGVCRSAAIGGRRRDLLAALVAVAVAGAVGRRPTPEASGRETEVRLAVGSALEKSEQWRACVMNGATADVSGAPAGIHRPVPETVVARRWGWVAGLEATVPPERACQGTSSNPGDWRSPVITHVNATVAPAGMGPWPERDMPPEGGPRGGSVGALGARTKRVRSCQRHHCLGGYGSSDQQDPRVGRRGPCLRLRRRHR